MDKQMKKVFANYYEEINMAYLTAKEHDSTVANEYASISNILDKLEYPVKDTDYESTIDEAIRIHRSLLRRITRAKEITRANAEILEYKFFRKLRSR